MNHFKMKNKFILPLMIVFIGFVSIGTAVADETEANALQCEIDKLEYHNTHCSDDICGDKLYNIKHLMSACGSLEKAVEIALEGEDADRPRILYFEPGTEYIVTKPIIIKKNSVQILGGKLSGYFTGSDSDEENITTISCRITSNSIPPEYTNPDINCSGEMAYEDPPAAKNRNESLIEIKEKLVSSGSMTGLTESETERLESILGIEDSASQSYDSLLQKIDQKISELRSNYIDIERPFIDLEFLTNKKQCRKIVPCITFMSPRVLQNKESSTSFGHIVEKIEINRDADYSGNDGSLTTGILVMRARGGVTLKDLKLTNFDQGIFLYGAINASIRNSAITCEAGKSCFVGIHVDYEDWYRHSPGNGNWISGITIDNYTNGIIYEHGNGSSITNSKFLNIKDHAIRLFGVWNLTINNNQFIYENGGITSNAGVIQLEPISYTPVDAVVSNNTFEMNCVDKPPIYMKHQGASYAFSPRLYMYNNLFNKVTNDVYNHIERSRHVEIQCASGDKANKVDNCDGNNYELNSICEKPEDNN